MMKAVRSELFVVYLFCAAFAAWAAFDVVSWLQAEQAIVASRLPEPVGLGAAIAGIAALMMLADWFFPLVNATLEDWQYKVRAGGKLRWFGALQFIQLLVCGFLGASVGAAQGFWWQGLLLALILRVALHAIHRRDIPTYLRGVMRNVLARASFSILDANLVSELLASSHLRMRANSATANFWVLMWRRFWRRPYIPVAFVSAIAISMATADVFGDYGIFVFFMVWSMLGTALMRCADFSKLGLVFRERFVVLGVHALLGALLLIALFPFGQPLVAAALFIPAILWAGIKRSQSRVVEKITFVDSGIGGLVSPEILEYYSGGLKQAAFLGFMATRI